VEDVGPVTGTSMKARKSEDRKLAVLPSVKLTTFTLKTIDEQLQVRGIIRHITTMLTLTHHCHRPSLTQLRMYICGAFGSA
jgi:pyridoxine/pyridoxamine 5'-phosphate oxidase